LPDPLLLLAIETTCDETGAAVLEGPRPPLEGVPNVRSSVVASQFDLHERFGGVVPEIASRAHVRHILPVLDEALLRAGVELKDLGATSQVELVTFGPSSPLLVWEQVALPTYARRASILFCPTYFSPLLYPGPIVVAGEVFLRWLR
jgi:hypothetical protein